MISTGSTLINEYLDFLKQKDFPCIAARAAAGKQQVKCIVADHMACPADDEDILQFMYAFVEDFRHAGEIYHSAAILFKGPLYGTEESFDGLMWQRLQALADLDAARYRYDARVSADPTSGLFSFSLHEEAFYIIGLHPGSNRGSRKFKYPVLVFNPHEQFEQLRRSDKYESMKKVVRSRDREYSGSVNPMLQDFGKASEVFQYSGRQYDEEWQCPLQIHHSTHEHNTAP